MILFFRTFVDTYTLEKKSNSVVILTTTKMAQGELNASEVFHFSEWWFLNKILRLNTRDIDLAQQL